MLEQNVELPNECNVMAVLAWIARGALDSMVSPCVLMRVCPLNKLPTQVGTERCLEPSRNVRYNPEQMPLTVKGAAVGWSCNLHTQDCSSHGWQVAGVDTSANERHRGA